MKDYLNKVIADKRAKLADLQKRGQESEDVNEVKAIINEVEEIKAEISDAEAQLEKLEEVVEENPETPAEENKEEEAVENNETEENKDEEPSAEEVKEEEKNEPSAEEITRSADWEKVDANNLNTLATFEQRGGNKMNEKNLEQRNAFMNALVNGDYSKLEKRDVTNTGNVEYVIPENLVNDIVTEVKNRGYIISKCNKTNFAVGQTIPVGLLNITASWVGAKTGTQLQKSGEGLGSTVQKGGVEAQIVFFNYKLRCEVALTYEAGIQSLPIFEQKFTQQVSDAMVDALEASVVSGDGVNQPKGILSETPNTGKALEIASGTKLKYEDIVKFVGAVPRKYRKGAVAFMTQNTFNDFMSIVDENGQPVAKINSGVDGELVYRLLGMPVELADEYLEDYSLNVTADTKFAFIYNFSEYTINTNYNLGISTKEDWDTEDKHIKAVLAADGKAVTKYSLVTYTKKASTTPSA